MPSIAEEILLLALDDEQGIFVYGPDIHLKIALSGAVLMELALANRLDTDPDRLFVVNPSPVGDDVLDEVLAGIAACESERPAGYWLNEIGEGAEAIRQRLIDRLVDRGILRRVEKKVFGIFETRRYPVVDDRAEGEVKRRIADVLLSDEIPDPRDVVIIGLVLACDLLETVLHTREAKKVRPRAEQIARMDLIGREVRNAINELRGSVDALASTGGPAK